MKSGAAFGLCVFLLAGCVHAKFPVPTPHPTPTQRAAATVPITPSFSLTTENAAFPGDPQEGDHLFHTYQPKAGTMCAACHRTDSDDRLIGPGLKSVGIRAQTRVEGLSASQYLHTSIVDPSVYVVDGYPNLMPKNWGTVFTDVQVNDLVAYLLSLS